MLVLDETLSSALLGVAAAEKLAIHTLDPDSLYNDPTTSTFLSKGIAIHLRQQVLWDLLLHYPATLSPFDNLDVSGLQSHGLVTSEACLDTQGEAYRQMTDTPETIRGVQELVLADLDAKYQTKKASEALDEFIWLQASRGHAVTHSMSSAMYDLFDTYDEYVAGVKTLFSDRKFKLPGQGMPLVSGEELGAGLAAASDREGFEAYKAYKPFADFVHHYASSASRWLALTQASRTLDAVLSAKIPLSLLNVNTRRNPQAVLRQLELSAQQGSTHAAVQIWLDEVRSVPKLRTIEDVLRLRDDKRINAFRDSMLEWKQCLANGVPAEEKRLRKLVRIANKEIDKLANVERMTRFWTFAALPLDILLLLYPPIQLPLPVTSLIGVTIQKATDEKTRTLGWVMFGRS